jgi:inhibitor of cysteine peptidase
MCIKEKRTVDKQSKLLLGTIQTNFVVLFSLTILISGCGSGHWDLYKGGGNSNSDSNATVGEYTISGTITANSVALTGVTVTLSGTSSGTATTDTSGNYSFANLESGSYTITPSMTGYIFTSVSQVVTVNGADVTGNDFTATASTGSTYSISGTVTTGTGGILSGVTITLSGANTGTVLSDASGNYSFANLESGSYTVTPSMTGYTFTPASQVVTVNGADVTGNDFTATASTGSTYSISGTVTTSTGGILSGVTITLSGANTGTVLSDASGNYSFANLESGSYTVTPSMTGYTFTPASQAVTVNGADVTGNDFTATASTGST